MDCSYDGITLSNRHNQIIYVNKSLERITGADRKDLIGKTPKDYKNEGLVLKIIESKDISNIINVIHETKTGITSLITSVPVYLNNELFYFSNYRSLNELENLQLDLMGTRKSDFFKEDELENFIITIGIIVKSGSMKKIIKTIAKISKTDILVTLTGESGVGKDVIAKLIHSLSNRSSQQMIQINCGAIPENLLESELFGYTEGSFTGAVKQGKLGLLELANNGTVFLDEIGDLPLNLQVKLLKVIQDQEILRIGGRKPIKLNLRIICATNQNLEDMIKKGKFREDLYFRINVVPIHIPPLRERKDDIIYLCQYFMNKFNKKYNTSKSFSIDVCNKLEGYNWPGNVRELENLIERLVLSTENERIDVGDLPPSFKDSKLIYKSHDFEDLSLNEIMEVVEKEILGEWINKYGSRKAAKKLGIDYSTLKRKKKKYLGC
ncbi:MAG: sigma-54 interaction domain-containing protein [Smithella sp.]